MSRPSNPNGVRRAHTRNGKPVRAASIKGRQAPKKRLNAGAVRRAKRKPMLLAAGTLFGLGALDAILTGRWGGFLVLGMFAGGFLIGHLAWSHHKKRQAAKPKQSAAEQRRKALAKARDQQERTAFAAERKRNWSKEGLKEFWHGGPAEDPEPDGNRTTTEPSDDGPPEMLSAPELNRKSYQPVPAGNRERAAATTAPKPRTRTKAWWPSQPREGTRAAYRFHWLRAHGYQGAIDQDGYSMTDIEVAREQAKRRGEKPREGPK